MKMVVCVKQVPDTEHINIDEATGSIIRSEGDAILNPYCEYALDFAVSMKEEGDSIIAVTMGPDSARDVLIKCLELGADEAYHLKDKDFAGSDTWATAYVLNRFLSSQEPNYDVLFCGKQAIDGDTAQVPAELAFLAGASQYYHVSAWHKSGMDIILHQDYGDEQRETILKPKSVVSVAVGSNNHRVPSMAEVLAARDKNITVLNRESLGLKKEECGRVGSLTKVSKITVNSHMREGQRLEFIDHSEAAEAILSKGGWI